jgi:hypothetical protein
MSYRLEKTTINYGGERIPALDLFHVGDSKSIRMGTFVSKPVLDFDPAYPAVGFDLADCQEIVSIAESIDEVGFESVWRDAADTVDDESEYE